MARIRWIYFLFSLGIGGLLLFLWARGEARTPSSLIDSAQARVERAREQLAQIENPGFKQVTKINGPAHDAALREFDAGLKMAEVQGDDDAISRGLELRANLYLERHMPQLALDDCIAHIERFGDTPEALRRAAEAALRCERPELALDTASRLRALDPEDPASDLYLGRAHLSLAEQALGRCEAMLEGELAPVQIEEAMTVARRAAALPEPVHGHGTSREEVRALFSSEDLAEEAIGYVDLAGEHTAQGLSALVKTLRETTDGSAIAGIQDILVDAGYIEAAAELGVLALRMNKLPNRVPTLVRTCLALEDLERYELARDIIESHQKKKRPLNLYSVTSSDRVYRWIQLTERLELWGLVYGGARNLYRRHGPNERFTILARYYQGVAASELGLSLDEVIACFAEVAPILPEDPKMTLRAWTLWAKAAGELGDRKAERYNLGNATRVPAAELDGDPKLRRLLGEAWLRRSEIEAADGEPTQAEVSATHALTLLPRKRKEIWSWLTEVGKDALVRRETTLETLRANLRSGQLPHGPRTGPFGVAVAVRYMGENELYDPLRSYTDLLLSEYPGHPDALEALLGLYEDSRTYSGVVETSLQLLENGFSPKRVRGALALVPSEYLSGRDLIRWMRADPSSAAGAVLRSMLDEGRIEEALSLATRPQLGAIDGETLALLGQRLGEAGYWNEAHAVFSQIQKDDPALYAHSGSMLRAGMYASILQRQSKLFSEAFAIFEGLALAEHLEEAEAGVGDLLHAFDTLYAAGRNNRAVRILERLEENPGTDTGEVLLRRAVFAAVTSKLEDYQRASERADPFFDDARVLLGELLVNSDARDWTEVARSSFELLRGEFGKDPARRTFLRILAGEFETAREDLELWQPAPDDPMGLLARLLVDELAPRRLSDGEDTLDFPESESLRAILERTDARFFAACGLSALTPPWSLWGLDRLRRIGSQGREIAGPWSAVLRARCLQSMGDPVLAERNLAAWTKPGEAFPPALYLIERGRRMQGADDEELLERQVQRMRAGGAAELDEVRSVLVKTRLLLEDENTEAAMSLLESAQRREPEAHELRVVTARLLRDTEQRGEAIELYDELFTEVPELAPRLVPEYIELLDATLEAGEIPEEVWWAELEALEAQLPEEPAVVLALAGREARQLGRGAGSKETTGPVRALERLLRFRKRTNELPIDELRRGIAVPWIELHGRLDPEGALELAHDELRANPLAPHLWLAYAKALDAAGRPEEALEILTVALAFTGTLEPQKMRALLRFEFTTNFTKLKIDIEKLERYFGELDDPELRFHRGLARLAAAKKRFDPRAEAQTRDAIQLWDRRDEFGWSAERYAPRLAIALSRSGRGGKALAVLGEISKTTADPLKSKMFASMNSIMRFQIEEVLERRKAAEEAKAAKAQEQAENAEAPPADGTEPDPQDAASTGSTPPAETESGAAGADGATGAPGTTGAPTEDAGAASDD